MAKKQKTGARKKKRSSSGGSSMLADDLKEHVKDTLKHWQLNHGGRAGIREKLVKMCFPTFDLELLTMMLARTQEFRSSFQKAKDANELNARVMPFAAALAFESVFQTCAAFWLAAGDPADPNKLDPSVSDFIDSQVKMFDDCLKAL